MSYYKSRPRRGKAQLRDDELALRLEQAVDTWRKDDSAIVVGGHHDGLRVRVLYLARHAGTEVVQVKFEDTGQHTWFFATNLVRLPPSKGT